MSMEITIRVAGIFDAVLLRDISENTFVETFADQNSKEDMDAYIAENLNLEQITAELTDTNNTFFTAWHGDRLAGYAKVRVGATPVELLGSKTLETERLYVLQEYHGKKVGAQLMAECLTFATEAGYETLWLGVWEHNQKAIAFYRKWGFETFGAHIFKLGTDDQTDILMSRAV